jgi:hypothetical protein
MGRSHLILLVIFAANTSVTGCVATAHSGVVVLPIFRASFSRGTGHRAAEPRPSVPGPTELVERSLNRAGVRFGTDGTVASLHAYMSERHEPVAAARAKPGDVVFFNLSADHDGCGEHVGLVEAVDGDGRLTFRESRGGSIRKSYLNVQEPGTRRDPSGRVLNTFLRSKRADDPAGARYFAGEMVCDVRRVKLTERE